MMMEMVPKYIYTLSFHIICCSDRGSHVTASCEQNTFVDSLRNIGQPIYPDNIRMGVDILGVQGTLQKEVLLVDKSIALDMESEFDGQYAISVDTISGPVTPTSYMWNITFPSEVSLNAAVTEQLTVKLVPSDINKVSGEIILTISPSSMTARGSWDASNLGLGMTTGEIDVSYYNWDDTQYYNNNSWEDVKFEFAGTPWVFETPENVPEVFLHFMTTEEKILSGFYGSDWSKAGFNFYEIPLK